MRGDRETRNNEHSSFEGIRDLVIASEKWNGVDGSEFRTISLTVNETNRAWEYSETVESFDSMKNPREEKEIYLSTLTSAEYTKGVRRVSLDGGLNSRKMWFVESGGSVEEE